jgi:hypothetical protein
VAIKLSHPVYTLLVFSYKHETSSHESVLEIKVLKRIFVPKKEKVKGIGGGESYIRIFNNLWTYTIQEILLW